MKELYARGGMDCIYSAKEEGQEYSDFDIFYMKHGTTEQRLNEIRDNGYVIHIVPYENCLYDDVAKAVQVFDENGRGEIIKKYDS